jgi:hypothetical protein
MCVMLSAGKRLLARSPVIGNNQNKGGSLLARLLRHKFPIFGRNSFWHIRRLAAFAFFDCQSTQCHWKLREPHFCPPKDLNERTRKRIAPTFSVIQRAATGCGGMKYKRLATGSGGECRD